MKATDSTPPTSVKRVLLVDDDEDECLFFTESLKTVSLNINLVCCNHPHRLEDKLTPKPDLIFLDINMPLRDGFECLEVIRTQYNAGQLPVVMISHSSRELEVIKAYEGGANLFVRKPDTLLRFSACLQDVLSMDWVNAEAIKELWGNKNKVHCFDPITMR